MSLYCDRLDLILHDSDLINIIALVLTYLDGFRQEMASIQSNIEYLNSKVQVENYEEQEWRGI